MSREQERTNEILQEIRIILPGTQALLGFQFVAFFNTAFKELSINLQVYHLVNLLLTTMCAILLIAPVAYQELINDGEYTARWRRFTTRSLTFSMLLLLAGLAGDIYIAGTMIEGTSNGLAFIAAWLVLLMGGIFWFGMKFVRRR